MREQKIKIRRYAGVVILILLFLVAFMPSALNPAEGTTGSDAAADVHAAARTAGIGTAGQMSGKMTFTGIGMGTVAVGTAIGQAAVLAVAASRPNSSNSTTIH